MRSELCWCRRIMFCCCYCVIRVTDSSLSHSFLFLQSVMYVLKWNARVGARLCQCRVWLSRCSFQSFSTAAFKSTKPFTEIFLMSVISENNHHPQISISAHEQTLRDPEELESLQESLIRTAFLNRWSFWWTDINIIVINCSQWQMLLFCLLNRRVKIIFKKSYFFPIFPCEKPCVVVVLVCVCCRKDALLFFN